MKSILGRTLISFLAFIALLGGIFVTTLTITKQQKDDGLIVNLSGRQRMLTQKMSKETLIYHRLSQQKKVSRTIQKKWEKQVNDTMTVFENTLFALKDGGPAPLDLAMTRFRDCPPAETKEIDRQLEVVVGLWLKFKANIGTVISSRGKATRALEFVISNNVELLSNMNKVVFQMQAQAEKKVALMAKIQLIAIALGVVIVYLSLIAINASVVTPIKNLIKAAEAMTTGDLDTQISTSGLTEISILSTSLNRLRVSLSAMMARYAQKSA